MRALSLTVLLYCARAARALSHAPPDYRVADHFSWVIFKVFRAVTAGFRGGGGGAHAILGGGSPVTGSMSLMSLPAQTGSDVPPSSNRLRLTVCAQIASVR